jgi:hypothetical protein
MNAPVSANPALTLPQGRLELREGQVKKGLGKLVLTLVELLRELLERQALRRIDGGGLTEGQVENLGLTLMQLAQEVQRLKGVFDLTDEELNLDLGPLGKLL